MWRGLSFCGRRGSALCGAARTAQYGTARHGGGCDVRHGSARPKGNALFYWGMARRDLGARPIVMSFSSHFFLGGEKGGVGGFVFVGGFVLLSFSYATSVLRAWTSRRWSPLVPPRLFVALAYVGGGGPRVASLHGWPPFKGSAVCDHSLGRIRDLFCSLPFHPLVADARLGFPLLLRWRWRMRWCGWRWGR